MKTKDHFTMEKDCICWYFGPRSWINQIKSSFFLNSNQWKACFRKMQFHVIFHQLFALNVENMCEVEVNVIWKDVKQTC